jgi:hypothetical protein
MRTYLRRNIGMKNCPALSSLVPLCLAAEWMTLSPSLSQGEEEEK